MTHEPYRRYTGATIGLSFLILPVVSAVLHLIYGNRKLNDFDLSAYSFKCSSILSYPGGCWDSNLRKVGTGYL